MTYKLTETYLADDFEMTGTNIDDFRDVLQQLVELTEFAKLNTPSMQLLSYVKKDVIIEEDKKTKNEKEVEKLRFLRLNPDNLPSYDTSLPIDNFITRLAIASIKEKGDTEKLINEIENEVKLALYNGKFHFVSQNIFSTMDSFGMKGHFLTTPTLERDMMIARRFASAPDSTFVIKHFGPDLRKVFAILSSNYTPVSQMQIFEIIDAFEKAGIYGNIVCRHWLVNHYFTEINLEFPDIADEISKTYNLPHVMIPGIRITTSDTGNCSLRIEGTWRVSYSCSITNEVSRRHSGNVDMESIVKETDKKIFKEYVKLPEKLCDLMLTTITPEGLDLSKEKDRKENFKAIEEMLKSIFKQLKMVKAVGKKREIEIRNLLLDEIDLSLEYSAYDLCMAIMSLPERLENFPSTDSLAKAIAYTAFCDYKPIEDEVYLS